MIHNKETAFYFPGRNFLFGHGDSADDNIWLQTYPHDKMATVHSR